MKSQESYLSNISYTKKDFNEIYPELLDLAKSISYKWDPTVSDESDPGVVLLKIAALMADKHNYNIDKNILEIFPLSVTQLGNARELYDQLGYVMNYYKSGSTEVVMTLVEEPEITESDLSYLSLEADIDIDHPSNVRTYVIPRFTMISDSEDKVVYTLTEEARLQIGKPQYITALQGTITEHRINGETLITPANLTYNNRLYLTGTNIPENGIFVESDSGKTKWKRVDNLMLESKGTHCYRFNVTTDGLSCYLEFPDDFDGLCGEGITVSYVLTAGKEGNIGKKYLTKLFTDVTGTRYIDSFYTQEITLTNDNISLTNENAVRNGCDPETISEAYRNYQRIKTTFETLVSLKDYTDFLYTNENISNGYVCDRTNDVESCYKVLSRNLVGNTYTLNTVIETPQVDDESLVCACCKEKDCTCTCTEAENIHPSMGPFDLRVYGLHYSPNPVSAEEFNRTFTLIPQNDTTVTDWLKILVDTEKIKSIQHNFKPFQDNKILMLFNRYPINCRIIPQTKLTAAQQVEVVATVVSKLYDALNSRKCVFGEKISYELVYDTILNADPRIRAIALDNIDYETHAVYQEKEEFKSVRIDSSAETYVMVPSNAKYERLETYYYQTPDGIYHNIDNYPNNTKTIRESTEENKDFLPYVTYYQRLDTTGLVDKFRKEILAKSVLAGTTQLFTPDTSLKFNLDMQNSKYSTNVTHISSGVTIYPEMNENSDGSWQGKFTLKNNENIVFTAPHLITEQTYGQLKYIHNIGFINFLQDETKSRIVIPKNAQYTLNTGEFIMFFWKPVDDDSAPYNYKIYVSSETREDSYVDTISPSMDLLVQCTRSKDKFETALTFDDTINHDRIYTAGVMKNIYEAVLGGVRNGTTSLEGTTDELFSVEVEDSSKEKHKLSFTAFVRDLRWDEFNLSGTEGITTLKENEILINDPNNEGSSNCVYWMLNTTTSENKYVLFDENQEEYQLKNGEYLMYTNSNRTQLVTLGVGTKIRRKCTTETSEVWAVDAIDYGDYIQDPIGYLDSRWYQISEGVELYACEMEFYQLGSDYSVSMKCDDMLQFVNPTYENCPSHDSLKHYYRWKINNTGTFVQALSLETGTTCLLRFNETSQLLRNVTIQYRDKDNSNITIPRRNNEKYAWKAYTLLNIDTSFNRDQEIVQCALRDISLAIGQERDKHFRWLNLSESAQTALRDNAFTSSSLLNGELHEILLGVKLYYYDGENYCEAENVEVTDADRKAWAEYLVAWHQMKEYHHDTIDLYIDNETDPSSIDYYQQEGTTKNTLSFESIFYFRTSRAVQLLGGVKQDIQLKDFVSNATVPLEVLSYKRHISNSTRYKYDHDAGTLIISTVNAEYLQPIRVQLDLPEGNYIIPIYVEHTSKTEDPNIAIGLAGYAEAYTSMTEKPWGERGFSYLMINNSISDLDSSYEITISPEMIMTMYPAFKYRVSQDEEFNELLSRVISYDINRTFDYTYVVPKDELIEDPLSASSFLLPNHVYNPYVICQWQCQSQKNNIVVVNNVK